MFFGHGHGRGIVAGAVIGIGGAAIGYWAYKNNQEKVDSFLQAKGIDVPCSSGKSYDSMSMEDLVTNKEKIEDLIAERESDS